MQSFWLVVLCLAAALFASVNSLATPANTVVRGVCVIAAIVALVIQIQFFRSLGEWEPGHVGTVVRQTRTYPKMGLYVTLTLTGLAILLQVWRLSEERAPTKAAAALDK